MTTRLFVPRSFTLPSHHQYRKLLLISTLTIFCIIYHYCYFTENNPSIRKVESPSRWISWSSAPKFWVAFAPLLASAAPRCQPPQLSKAAKAKLRFTDPSWKLDEPKDHLSMTSADIEVMHRAHTLFVNLVHYSSPTLDYERGTKGIVTSAGGEYFPVVLVSLFMLRRTGSTLPVEVFLATPDEYEEQICEVVFPSLNARCIILSDILDTVIYEMPPITHFQLKVFAILFSSFESVLFLDADNFPVSPPEKLFDSAPFTTHGLVLWPDYWSSTVSPQFANISGLPYEILRNEATTESGQILVSKKKHGTTLMLAAYYNTYSEYFYPLITQGGPGEGDKDTFAPAAMVMGVNYYMVRHELHSLGRRVGGAILQYDPISDYEYSSTNHNTTNAQMLVPQPFFVHASWSPKLNAWRNVQRHRQWGLAKNSKRLFNGTDIESVVWGYMTEMACSKTLQFADWGGGDKSVGVEDRGGVAVCEQTRECFRKMFGREYKRS